MKKVIISILFSFISKLINKPIVIPSVNSLIENKIIPTFPSIYKVRDYIAIESENINELNYELTFVDGKSLSFCISFNRKDIEFYFKGTDIIHLDVLSNTINSLIQQLKNNQDLIKQYFIVHLKNSGC